MNPTHREYHSMETYMAAMSHHAPDPTTPLPAQGGAFKLPLRYNDKADIFDADGFKIGETATVEEAAAIVHAVNSHAKLETDLRVKSEILEKLQKAKRPFLPEFADRVIEGQVREMDVLRNELGTIRKQRDLLQESQAKLVAEVEGLRKDKERLDWLEKHHEFHFSGPYEECDPSELHLVEGNINDREYRLVGEGETLRECIDAALQPPTGEGK